MIKMNILNEIIKSKMTEYEKLQSDNSFSEQQRLYL